MQSTGYWYLSKEVAHAFWALFVAVFWVQFTRDECCLTPLN